MLRFEANERIQKLNDDMKELNRQAIDGTLLTALESMVRNIAMDSEAVKIRIVSEDTLTVLNLSVADCDMGKILGPKRVTLDSIRCVIDRIGSRLGIDAYVELMEPKSVGNPTQKQWDANDFEAILQSVLKCSLESEFKIVKETTDCTTVFRIEATSESPKRSDTAFKVSIQNVFMNIARSHEKRGVYIEMDLSNENAPSSAFMREASESVSTMMGRKYREAPYGRTL